MGRSPQLTPHNPRFPGRQTGETAVTKAEYNLTIKELPLSERPRERLLHAGASALSTTELMAIILAYRCWGTERSVGLSTHFGAV